ncbi:polymeric immunoglobulin receptor-like isoform X2 [Paramisgurnus dabryanus]|uniref:polymeric immunoglobulin receptor-like isoform X2 n=1 Tax=Paramisgurnus dabryanus TaxID=90735 RepID=UPI0031F34FA9
MVAYRKTTYFYIIWFFHILGPECFSDGSYSYDTRHLSVKSGGSVTIPCYYDRKYTQQMKFWYSEYDNIRIYTNTTAGDVIVIDDPAQSLFTVTMRNLKGGHNGTYYCAVETGEQPGDMTTTDDLYLHVQPAPDVSVMSSSVTVDEGGNISVQCLYSNKYKNKHKQWCRYKDKSCYTSQNASIEISDDGRGSLTVVMSGLMKSDSGWYYCSVNVQQPPVQDLLVPVQITVKAAATPDNSTESKTETENNTKNTIPAFNEQQPSAVPLWIPVTAGVLLLMILVGVFIWKWKRRSDSNVDTTNCVVEDPSGHKAVTADGTLYSTVEPHYQNPQKQ